MKLALKYYVLPLLAAGCGVMITLQPSAAQNTSTPTPDTSVPAVVAPPAAPKVPSGIGQGTKAEAVHMGTLDAADAEFVRKAAMGGLAEVAGGEVAEKSGNEQVKQFGRKMVEDHGKANKELASIAQEHGMAVPTTLEADDRTKIEKFSSMSGHDFDRAYIAGMIEDHKKDVALFEKEASDGKDPAVKQFAQETLPTIKEHLDMAQALLQKIASN